MKIVKKLIFLASLFVFAGFGAAALAQETGLANPGLTPDSPFYFLDTLGEKASLFFTFSPEKKAEKALRYADEKMAEASVMAEKNKLEAAEKGLIIKELAPGKTLEEVQALTDAKLIL